MNQNRKFPPNYEDIPVVLRHPVTTEEGVVVVETFTESPYKGLSAESFSLSSVISSGGALRPSPKLAQHLDTLDGVDAATSVINHQMNHNQIASENQ